MVAALLDAALVIVPAVLLLTASFEYLDVASLDRPADQFCDDYLDEVGGFCLDLADVNDRVYFADSTNPAATLYYWGGTFLLLVVLQGLTGWTPGKLLTGIRTVREDGRPAGLVKAFVRWFLWIVDAFPYVVPLLGFIVALTTTGHRRVGDMVAKTFVVRASAAGRPVVVAGLTPGVPAADGLGPSGPWAAPASTPSPVSPTASGPQWDPARNTYIQWDATQRTWLQWDEATRAWSPIPGQ